MIAVAETPPAEDSRDFWHRWSRNLLLLSRLGRVVAYDGLSLGFPPLRRDGEWWDLFGADL
jgi:hypothetical protein